MPFEESIPSFGLSHKSLKIRELHSADDGTRTHTDLSVQRILSPLRLPFRHIGLSEQARNQAVLSGSASTKWEKLLNRWQFFDFTALNKLRSIGLGSVRFQTCRMATRIDLSTENGYLFGCLDSNLDCITINFSDLEMNEITNDNTFVNFSG